MKWKKKVVERVKSGEMMLEVETDKVVVVYEVHDDVFVLNIFASEGIFKIVLGQPDAILVNKEDRDVAF